MGMPDDRSLERQMGCMAGFRQLFDRHHLILAGKRQPSTKRLPPSTAVDSTSTEAISIELQQQPSSSIELPKSAIGGDAREPKLFEFKEGFRSSWKLRESPRLSLDSQTIVNGKGIVFPREIRTNPAIFSVSNREISAQSMAIENENEKNRRSPSVVARLMGLESLPDSDRVSSPHIAELRRSASESRASRDLMQYQFIDGNRFSRNVDLEERSKSVKMPDSMEFKNRVMKYESPKDPTATASSSWSMRKSFFDSQDFFPEPKRNGSLYGEIEKRLKMRGIEEPEKDLETLKQILEALQLKGLLHSKKFICNRKFEYEEAPIVVMKHSRSPPSIHRPGRTGNESRISNSRSKPGIRRNLVSEAISPAKSRSDRNLQSERRSRHSRASDVSDSGAKSPSSLARRGLSVETEKKGKDCNERRSSSCVSPKKVGIDLATSRSSRNRKQTAEISPLMEDESSTISESSVSASSSQTDSERMKVEECKEGRNLLERCVKLLHSIAEITTTEQQPSPVSVLDSSFYKEDNSPSPVLKRCINFKADHRSAESKDDWSLAILPVRSSKPEEESPDLDFLYISEILSHQTTPCENNKTDLFSFLEKQHYYTITNCSSKLSRLHRRLVFDTVTEILHRNQQPSTWKAFIQSKSASSIIVTDSQALVGQIWSKLGRIRERPPTEEVCDVVCGVLAKDMVEMDGWDEQSVEMSDNVLDIERLIFKDLVGEAIRDLVSSAGKCMALAPRRKLVF